MWTMRMCTHGMETGSARTAAVLFATGNNKYGAASNDARALALADTQCMTILESQLPTRLAL